MMLLHRLSLYLSMQGLTFQNCSFWTSVIGIEEVSKQKPRQTVVVVLRGKIAAHMASIKTVKQTS